MPSHHARCGMQIVWFAQGKVPLGHSSTKQMCWAWIKGYYNTDLERYDRANITILQICYLYSVEVAMQECDYRLLDEWRTPDVNWYSLILINWRVAPENTSISWRDVPSHRDMCDGRISLVFPLLLVVSCFCIPRWVSFLSGAPRMQHWVHCCDCMKDCFLFHKMNRSLLR